MMDTSILFSCTCCFQTAVATSEDRVHVSSPCLIVLWVSQSMCSAPNHPDRLHKQEAHRPLRRWVFLFTPEHPQPPRKYKNKTVTVTSLLFQENPCWTNSYNSEKRLVKMWKCERILLSPTSLWAEGTWAPYVICQVKLQINQCLTIL